MIDLAVARQTHAVAALALNGVSIPLVQGELVVWRPPEAPAFEGFWKMWIETSLLKPVDEGDYHASVALADGRCLFGTCHLTGTRPWMLELTCTGDFDGLEDLA